MKNSSAQHFQDWLLAEAHLTAKGHPFHFKDLSCLPVSPEGGAAQADRPSGFFVTHGADMGFVGEENPDWQTLAEAWEKEMLLEILTENDGLPSECWFG